MSEYRSLVLPNIKEEQRKLPILQLPNVKLSSMNQFDELADTISLVKSKIVEETLIQGIEVNFEDFRFIHPFVLETLKNLEEIKIKYWPKFKLGSMNSNLSQRGRPMR